jgi:hypothetical protein
MRHLGQRLLFIHTRLDGSCRDPEETCPSLQHPNRISSRYTELHSLVRQHEGQQTSQDRCNGPGSIPAVITRRCQAVFTFRSEATILT